MPSFWQQMAWSWGVLSGTFLLTFVLVGIALQVLHVVLQNRNEVSDRLLTRHCRKPLQLLVAILATRTVLPGVDLTPSVVMPLSNAIALLLIAAVTYLTIRLLTGLEEIILGSYEIDVKDNLQARKIHTQVRFLKRIATVIVMIVATASALMLFEKVRQLGTSILASAGILGIVIGLAAQRVIANLLVGIQIAVSQPIRIDDVVIIENEWGRIEEITATYVVVRIWDLRRLVVPLTYFVERPFQNWTRISADLLCTVFIYLDYTVPVATVREQLHEILKQSEYWDGKVWGLQVTDAKEMTMELRALMSASNASLAWNLRCEVRERLIDFIQHEFPESLPRLRAKTELSTQGCEDATGSSKSGG